MGDLVSEQELRLIVMVSFAPGDPDEELAFTVSVADRDGRLGGEAGRLTFRRVSAREDAAQPADAAVARILAEAEGETAIREGLSRNRGGDFAGAAGVVRRVADRLKEQFGDDPAVNHLVADLKLRSEELGGHLDSPTTKGLSYRTSHRLRSREPDGKSRRRK